MSPELDKQGNLDTKENETRKVEGALHEGK